MEDEFKLYREFLNHLHGLLLKVIKSGKCEGKQIKWRRRR